MYYLYRFLDADEVIIYIGKTKNALRTRFFQHSHLPKACYSAVNKIEFLECSTEADMSMKEIYYINKYKSQGMAEYNVADVSTLPQEIEYDEDSDVWEMYEGSLPEAFSSSINVREGFKEEEKEFVQRADGKTVRFSQNSKVGKEKFAYPLSVDGVEQAIYYFIDKMSAAQNWRYLFYHFRNIVILSMGVSTPMKSNELIELKICNVYDNMGRIKPFEYKSKGANEIASVSQI